MARRRRYRGRRYSRSYRGRRSNGGIMGLSMPMVLGLVAGYTDIDKQIPLPGDVQVGIATVPARGLGKIKSFFQGVVFGNVLQNRLGGAIGTGSGTSRRF